MAIPGPWATKNDDLQQFTLSGYCFRASTTAEFSCVGYNAFSLPGSNVTFSDATPEAVSVAFGMTVAQVAFNVVTLFLLAFFYMSLGAEPSPLGNVLYAKISAGTAALAFIFGLVAMLAIGETGQRAAPMALVQGCSALPMTFLLAAPLNWLASLNRSRGQVVPDARVGVHADQGRLVLGRGILAEHRGLGRRTAARLPRLRPLGVCGSGGGRGGGRRQGVIAPLPMKHIAHLQSQLGLSLLGASPRILGPPHLGTARLGMHGGAGARSTTPRLADCTAAFCLQLAPGQPALR